ncbi:MAG: thiamine phosphate synthase [Bacteroidetes bacterium]|nr:thiamine phosphate synthase [Bacteroidota bacterium]
MNAADFRFYAITDRQRCGMERMLEQLNTAFEQGLRAVQIREKDLPAQSLLQLALEIKRSAHAHGAMVLINDRLDIAMAAGLDGVHLPERGMPVADARRLLGDHLLIGVSAHDAGRVQQASDEGADFCVAGPVSETISKDKGHWIMPEAVFKDLCRKSSIPVFALGGIHAHDIQKWTDLGARGIAGISIWLEDENISETFEFMKKSLGSL